MKEVTLTMDVHQLNAVLVSLNVQVGILQNTMDKINTEARAQLQLAESVEIATQGDQPEEGINNEGKTL